MLKKEVDYKFRFAVLMNFAIQIFIVLKYFEFGSYIVKFLAFEDHMLHFRSWCHGFFGLFGKNFMRFDPLIVHLFL